MGQLTTICHETILLLRRDKIFLAAEIAAATLIIFAHLASEWVIEDFRKILFDIGIFGYQAIGSLLAIYWGTRFIADPRSNGALEVQLAAPISRAVWLIGRYLGLCICLLLFAAIFCVFWQVFLLLNRHSGLTLSELWIFAYGALGWFVIAALGLCFSSFCGPTVALFSTLSLWFAGNAVHLVYNTLAPSTPLMTRKFVAFMAKIWDLQHFNIASLNFSKNEPLIADLLWRGGYGASLILFLITTGCLVFQRRDIVHL